MFGRGIGIGVLAACSAAACLPGDERPPPAAVLLVATADDATRSGFTTGDGWDVRFDRFVTALGDVDLEDVDGRPQSCVRYNRTRYEWLYDFVQVAEPGKVGLVFGLGDCELTFRMRAPSDDTVLGVGASEADIAFMRPTNDDVLVSGERVAVWVQGSATRNGVTKTFDWAFRHSYEIGNCAALDGDGDGSASLLPLVGETDVRVVAEIRGAELFRVSPSDASRTHFERFATADIDGDGDIALAELFAVPAPGKRPYDWPLGGFMSEAPPQAWTELPFEATLGWLVYETNLPRVARLAGAGPCEPEDRNP